MASIENRSRYIVTVQNRDDLTQHFAYNREKALKAYIAQLRAEGYKPKLARTNDQYAIRIREAGHRSQCLYASSEEEAIRIKQRIELERRSSLFIDYAKGRSVTFGDLLARYLHEISPRHKGFEVEGYIINAILADAGLPRVDLADAYTQHKNPHPSLAGKNFRRASGKQVRSPSAASCFIRKPFADLLPDDLNDYIDDRCQSVAASTVDREVDIFSAVSNMAIDTWRIPVAKNPMDGVRRPKYFNERDRRLKDGEEARLLNAAYDEDAQQSIERRLEALMAQERATSLDASTTYRRKAIIKAARATFLAEAEATYVHVPWMEGFIQFQLMTGARRSETLALTWANIDLNNQTAFVPESKNGRPRTLALRKDVIALLEQLPRETESVFPIHVDALRKAWTRICKATGLTDEAELHVHDLRHEAISRVADNGSKLPGGLSLADLQAFSGHRDIRMLMRYTHLCMPSMAKRLDAVFADEKQITVHRGQRRLKQGAALTIAEIANAAARNDASTLSVPSPQNAPTAPNNVLPLRIRSAA
ncbi:site-specific integrase [Paraburkholderia hospita]|uniref:site-specific integrase n=1 Tax=Paraburkholderia hospita TaxID=169430 RepID=UPI0002716196|nr:site-specific integrase [Paraburkholderia hospita]EUC15021.1 integrase family protein [Burkholderia sp. BT03]SKC94365.1 Phage integrase family protein [Paraburkholderia hospita]